jgi:2-polyprenyl-3-methyl-5-hydroxy-6-metoxy-1,4-benzoquinol methylase/uncharacterized protein (DUF433 family)
METLVQAELDPKDLRRKKITILRTPGALEWHRSSLSDRALGYFDSIGTSYARWRRHMGAYLDNTKEFLTRVVPENQKVLVVGCCTSEILASLRPSHGVALDVSPSLVRWMVKQNCDPKLFYHCSLPENFESEDKFDYVILLNMVDHSQDLLYLVDSLKRFCHDDTVVIVSMLNPLWHRLVQWASRLRIRMPDFDRNLIASRALQMALEVKQFRVTDVFCRVLVPKRIPLVSGWVNQYLARLPLVNRLGFLQYVFAKAEPSLRKAKSSCTVIIPCYNEEENIEVCVRRVPQMGPRTEILVVNDGSEDHTAEVVERLKGEFPNLVLVTYEKNRGKGQAVLEGIRRSTGEILMILDADMTVPPEELVEFYDAIESRTADFVSGTRFLYPMEKEAMRLANYFGNILFSKLVEWIVGSKCSDTLCGTKAMRKKDFENFRLEDSAWGDFDLIFHAAKRKLKCVQVPVHYKSRVRGVSKMKAFTSGISFLKLCLRKWSELP